MRILAIESSCDETAVAIVEDGRRILTDCIASQVALHREYGGVVPEIASRKHVEAIAGLTDQALTDAGLTKKDIVATLKNIYDPEIPVNIYDLGLIYEIDYTPDGAANIRMTLTAPNCPMAEQLVEDVNRQVAKVDGVREVNVILTFDPVWDKSMMSEEALLELNLL